MVSKAQKAASLHWVVPTTAILSLFSGVAFAIGHHCFCSGLNDSRAREDGYKLWNTEVSHQQINIAVGTAFAFLVKVALATAISTAYVQFLWRSMLRSSCAATLQDLDTLFPGISNVISLFKVWVWRHYATLCFLALLTW